MLAFIAAFDAIWENVQLRFWNTVIPSPAVERYGAPQGLCFGVQADRMILTRSGDSRTAAFLVGISGRLDSFARA